ncbi:DUF6056 family protein [Salinicola sp. JS01]|uniref:DUF6056 family protein n=1 Tax=Salinicola sp. JS01 TaxID=3050071 RepID=UPI00255B7348|nr:DUF6056 family protein [Salinicola sp. JS01]WIX33801.1 DUF6056 family protein [Salinicola sp. JS01]
MSPLFTRYRGIAAAGAAFSLAVYAAIFWRMPLMGEDFAFPLGYGAHGWGERLAWIAHKIPAQTADWNARLGEQLAIVWLNLPAWLFWLVALAAFVAFAALIAMVWGRRDLPFKLALTLGLMFGLWPGLEIFFWKTANAGYLQPIVLSLVCIVAYRSEAAVLALSQRPWRLFGLCVVAAGAGYSFENVPVALALYMALAWWLLPARRVAWPVLLPVAAMLAGWAALMAMPSTAFRRAFYLEAKDVHATGPAYYWERAGEVTDTFFDTAEVLVVLTLVSLLFLAHQQRRGRLTYDRRMWWSILPAVLVVGSMLAAPYTEPRAFSLAWALMLALVVEALSVACRRWRWAVAGCTLALLVSAGLAIKTLTLYENVSRSFDAREARIVERLGTPACETGVAIRQRHFDYPRRYFNNRDDWYLWSLWHVGNYYGCKLVPAE